MDKRDIKKQSILDAAEVIFRKHGHEKAKMEDIAAAIEMSKGSIYFYFESKENLFMALIDRAIQKMLDILYQALAATKDLNRYDAIVYMATAYMDFALENPYYFELIQHYTRFVRQLDDPQSSKLLNKSASESYYFRKIKDVHNLPLKIFAEEIKKGQVQQSITSKSDPGLLFLSIWAVVSGYSELHHMVISEQKSTIYKVSVQDWRDKTINIIRLLLS